MNTIQLSTCWLGLALASGIITFAASVEAKKPPKPPPEPPDPGYQIIPLEGALYPNAISASGILAGLMVYDGNPWFADVDGDDINDLLVALAAPTPGESVTIDDLNNLGQVVGHSGGHVVRWDVVEDLQIITDLGTLSRNLSMFAKGMNDSGQIVGTSAKTQRLTQAGPSWLIKNDTIYELSVRPTGINNDGWICGSSFVAIPVEP